MNAPTASRESPPKTLPLLGFAQAGSGGYFDDAGFPAGEGWDQIAFPEVADTHAYALKDFRPVDAAGLSGRRRDPGFAVSRRCAAATAWW